MCRVLGVSRQGYRKHLESLNKPPKHAPLLAAIRAIIEEDEFNDKYGRQRIHDALVLRGWDISLSTVYRVCRKYGLLQKPNKPKGLTKADKEAYKNDDILNGDFTANGPLTKLVGDITQLPTADGTLYIGLTFDCFDDACLGLAMDDNMEAQLVERSLEMATSNKDMAGTTFHSDRGSQYTSNNFRKRIKKHRMKQSMSYAKASCFGNAKCESLIGRFKVEAIYDRYDTENMSMTAVKALVFRYFMGYWNNRRICHAIGGMPPMEKRRRHYQQMEVERLAA
jgi:transposase InsO family protein